MGFRRLARWAFAIATVAVVVASLTPADELPSLDLWDKLEHAIAYAVLAVLGALSWSPRPRTGVRLGISLIALGLILELLQSLVPGRLTDAGDALANSVGTLAGLGAVAAIGRIAGRAGRLGQPGR